MEVTLKKLLQFTFGLTILWVPLHFLYDGEIFSFRGLLVSLISVVIVYSVVYFLSNKRRR